VHVEIPSPLFDGTETRQFRREFPFHAHTTPAQPARYSGLPRQPSISGPIRSPVLSMEVRATTSSLCGCEGQHGGKT
jgi:hypothetical protein